VPHRLPRPPNTDVPPRTTAVTASSSYPVPASARAWPRCATYTTAARLATRPDSTYTSAVRALTGRPAYRALSGENPTAYSVRPITDRCSRMTYARKTATNNG